MAKKIQIKSRREVQQELIAAGFTPDLVAKAVLFHHTDGRSVKIESTLVGRGGQYGCGNWHFFSRAA